MKRFILGIVSAAFLAAVMANSAAAFPGLPLLGPGVPAANPRSGHPANVVAPGFALKQIAQGSDPLENPSGVITKFGYINDFPPRAIEATKTEPDGNLYLQYFGATGPTKGYCYGTHFLFQSHEGGGANNAYVTRINLDVKDPAHRITLLTPVNPITGTVGYNSLDGISWDPFTHSLIASQEAGSNGGVITVDPNGNGSRALYGSIGHGGFEGIHADNRGRILLVEDQGGKSVPVNPADPNSKKAAKQPNSFIFRFIPTNPGDLTAGKLQALQVTIDGTPLTFNAADPSGDVFSPAQLKLHTLGTSYPVKWVTVHDTAADGTTPFDANAAAKTAGATPFKRPENGEFWPGAGFNSFGFTTTGDTSKDSGDVPALAARGAYGAFWRVDFPWGGDNGKISIKILGDAVHNSFDIVDFSGPDSVAIGEDRGSGLHTSLNALDSLWSYGFDWHGNATAGKRLLAEGRDPSAEIDANYIDSATPGFQNEDDNEVTGMTFSDGIPTVAGLPGNFDLPWLQRGFFTQQHGDNNVWELLKK